MIGLNFQFTDNFRKVQQAADKAQLRNIQRAAFATREDAIASIKQADGPSPPGQPPHTHTQKLTKKGKLRKGNFQRAIVYDVNKQEMDAFVGPRFSVVGESFHAHEFGDDHHGDDYPERPTMGPALERQMDEFANSFAGSIGE